MAIFFAAAAAASPSATCASWAVVWAAFWMLMSGYAQPAAKAVAVAAVAAQSPDLRYAATLALGLASPGSLPALRGLDALTDRAVAWWQRVGTQVVDRPM